MKKIFSTLVAVFALSFSTVQTVYAAGEIKADSLAAAKKHFATSKGEIEAMLWGRQPLSYERAIYLLENAYWEGAINAADFSESLDEQTVRIRRVLKANRIAKGYNGTLGWMETEADKRAKYDKAMANFAIFTYLTDTTFFVEKDGQMRYHMPMRYTHKDPMGSIAWPNTQVTNLLQNGHGNCFALASLYYIFSERLNADASLCTAPGHIYISHPDDKGTRYNLELSSGTFPGNGTIITQSYATMEAVKSGIALRELNRKQAIAMTLVYLAKGYAHKFGVTSDAFILACAESALKADSLNLNALLLKAEVLEDRLLMQDSSVAQLQSESDFQNYEALLAKLYRLGYREIPLEMKNILMAGFQRDTLPYKTRNYTSQPFKKYGMENDRHASLSWGLFDETHETKPQELYGRTLFDTKSRRITGFAEKETLYNGYDFDPVAFAWNVDPLAKSFASLSPYAFAQNSPIAMVDKQGLHGEIVINKSCDPKGATITTVNVNAVYLLTTEQQRKATGDMDFVSYARHQIKNTYGRKEYSGTVDGKMYNASFNITIRDGLTAAQANSEKLQNPVSNTLDINYVNERGKRMGTGGGGRYVNYDTRQVSTYSNPFAHETSHILGEEGDMHMGKNYMSNYVGDRQVQDAEVNELLAPAMRLVDESEGSTTIHFFSNTDAQGNETSGGGMFNTYRVYDKESKKYLKSTTVPIINPQPPKETAK